VNIFARGSDNVRLSRKHRITITSALNLAADQWLETAAKETNNKATLLALAGEAKALAILLEPDVEEEPQS
jgi:hypothetical protein